MKFIATFLDKVPIGTLYRYKGEWYKKLGPGSIKYKLIGRYGSVSFHDLETHSKNAFVAIEKPKLGNIYIPALVDFIV